MTMTYNMDYLPWQIEDQIKAMMGKKIKSVTLEGDRAKVTFNFTDGSFQAFGVEGDCCSHSWIEHLELPRDLEGATVLDFAEDYMNATEDDAYNPKRTGEEEWDGQWSYRDRQHEDLKVYNSRFITDRGEIVLEYRNSSNGYYGGSLVAV